MHTEASIIHKTISETARPVCNSSKTLFPNVLVGFLTVGWPAAWVLSISRIKRRMWSEPGNVARVWIAHTLVWAVRALKSIKSHWISCGWSHQMNLEAHRLNFGSSHLSISFRAHRRFFGKERRVLFCGLFSESVKKITMITHCKRLFHNPSG